MKTNFQTKQNPVAELSGFCYTSVNEQLMARLFFVSSSLTAAKLSPLVRGLSLASFQVRQPNNRVLNSSQRNGLLVPYFQFLSSSSVCISQLVLTFCDTHEWLKVCSVPYLFFNERSARSESIITKLTDEVKNVALKLRKIWLGIKLVLERTSENLSKNGLTTGQVLTSCGVILSDELLFFTKFRLSTSGQCGVILAPSH